MATPTGMVEACLPIQFSTGVPVQTFRPQEGLVVMANDAGPAYVGHRKQGLQNFAASAWVPAAGVAEPSLGRRWLDDFPWWGWALLVLLALFWLRRAFS